MSYDVKTNKNVQQVLGYLLKYILLYLNRTKTQRGVPFIPSPLPLCSAVGGRVCLYFRWLNLTGEVMFYAGAKMPLKEGC